MIKNIQKSVFILISIFTVSTAYAQLDLGKIISSGSKIIEKATSTSNFDVKELVGTWKYVSPAVSMAGDNTLANIGGVAASTAIEDKLANYYNKAGIQNAKLTVNDDLSFSWSLGKVTLTGKIEKEGEKLAFNFSAFNKIKIGKVNCKATKSGSTIELTFDTSKLLALAQQISAISSNSTFKTLSSALSSYKDLYVGMKMKK